MVKGMERKATFEVFKSNGTWAMLFGKLLLKIFNAVHDYKEDTYNMNTPKGRNRVGNLKESICRQARICWEITRKSHSGHQTTHYSAATHFGGGNSSKTVENQ